MVASTTRRRAACTCSRWHLPPNAADRREILDETLPGLLLGGFHAEPRHPRSIEWFASGRDLCRALHGLYEETRSSELAPVADIMTISDGGLGLSAQQWRTTWYKGGNEAGVRSVS
jgi:hypothetical protein